MTNKEFVKRIYPTAFCKWINCLPNEYEVSATEDCNALLGWGSTPNSAWYWARILINDKMMEKLES